MLNMYKKLINELDRDAVDFVIIDKKESKIRIVLLNDIITLQIADSVMLETLVISIIAKLSLEKVTICE